MSIRLRTIRRQFSRLLNKTSDRKLAEYRKRSADCEAAFRELNARIPELNAAAMNAADGHEFARIVREMAANHSASSLVLAQWADAVESASKLVAER
jgi:hypothetical protein